jgi:hypothetical protein
MDPNFYKSDSKFKQMLQLLKPRGSGDFSKLNLGNLSSKKDLSNKGKDSPKLTEETGFFPKLRHSVHFTGNFLEELKNFNSSPVKKNIHQPDQWFEKEKELKRKISEGDDVHSFVIDTLAPKDKKEIVSFFLPTLEDFKNVSETEYTNMDDDNHVDKTDSGSENDIFESSHALDESESFSDMDHPEILKLFQK